LVVSKHSFLLSMLWRASVVAAVLSQSSAFRKVHKAKGDSYSKYDGKVSLSLKPSSEQDMKKMEETIAEMKCADISNTRTLQVDAICDIAHASVLMANFPNQVTVEHTDAGAYLRNSSGNTARYARRSTRVGDPFDSGFYTEWRSYEDRMARLEDVVAAYGDVATLESIGTSVQGRPIKAIRFKGAGWSSGDARVVVSFQLHAREWIVGMAGLFAAELMSVGASSNSSFLAGVAVDLIPTVNPDGTIYSETSERFWRKNMADNAGDSCKGVDLNRNWDPAWAGPESTSSYKCSDIFYGSSAFSEPETQALKNLIDESPVYVHLDVHSYGHMILAPYSHTRARHPKRDQIDVLGKAMQRAVSSENGQTYDYGGSEVLYPASGVCPDYATSLGGFGFTYELRPGSGGGLNGFAPPASDILPASSETWAGIVAAIEWAKTAPRPEPPAPTPAPPPPDPCPYDWCSQYCWYGPCQSCSVCR